jgi:hypothetical protein
MSQPSQWGVPLIPPSTPSAMAARIQGSLDGLMSSHSGPTAPPYAVAGTRWADTAVANRITFKVYDGADWIVDGVLDTVTNAYRAVSINPLATVASAATTDIGAALSDSVQISGTTTITSFGTAPAGTFRRLRFSDVLTVTHNGASLICPGGVSIVTAANDSMELVSLGSGNWAVLSHAPAIIRVAQTPTRAVTSASSAGDRTLKVSDAGRMMVLNGSADIALSTDAMATLATGWFVDLRCDTSILATLTPAGGATVDGATTLVLARGQTCRLFCDGANLRTLGIQRRVQLGVQVTTSAVSSVEFEIPPGYRQLSLSGTYALSTGAFLFAQPSNNGGSTWQTTSYAASRVGGSGGAAFADDPSVTGLFLASGTTSLGSMASDIFLGEFAGYIRCSSRYFAGVTVALAESRLTTLYAGTNRIRIVPATGTISSTSMFILEGLRT